MPLWLILSCVPQFYQATRRPTRMTRCCACTVEIVLVMAMKFEGLDTIVLGRSNAGVLVKFNASARNWRFHRSVTWNERNNPKFVLPSLGPRRAFRPIFPKRTAAVQGSPDPTGAAVTQTSQTADRA